MPNLFVPMIFAWLNFWRTCFSVSPSMYINPFMFPICPGVILSELSSSLRSNSLGVFDKQFRGLSGNFWLVSFKISYLCLPLFYETRTTPSCHPSGCAYRQL